MPYLFGQKIEAVRKILTCDNAFFSNPKRLEGLMEDFAPYAALRSELAYAVIVTAKNPEISVYAFDNAGMGPLPDTKSRFWVTEKEAKDILVRLKQLSKHITDQKFQSPNPASSQHLPKQAATAGL